MHAPRDIWRATFEICGALMWLAVLCGIAWALVGCGVRFSPHAALTGASARDVDVAAIRADGSRLETAVVREEQSGDRRGGVHGDSVTSWLYAGGFVVSSVLGALGYPAVLRPIRKRFFVNGEEQELRDLMTWWRTRQKRGQGSEDKDEPTTEGTTCER